MTELEYIAAREMLTDDIRECIEIHEWMPHDIANDLLHTYPGLVALINERIINNG